MRNTTPVLTLLTVLVSSSACAADNLLDQAGQCLSAGDAKRAVETYRQANAELPTTEGYNNLGIALERTGQFAEAAVAYSESFCQPNATGKSDGNLKRARLRALVQAGLPYAARVLAALLAIFAVVWAVKWLVQAWRAWRFRMKFRDVRALGLTHRIRCRDGQNQPDGKAYSDSESISFHADVSLPQRCDIFPLHLDLEIDSPDGTIWRTVGESVPAGDVSHATICFKLEQIDDLLSKSGVWKAQLILRNTNKPLAATAFTVVTWSDLLADLHISDTRLITVQGDKTVAAEVVLTDVEAIVPYAMIRVHAFHPTKFAGMRLRLELANVDRPGEIERQDFPLELIDGKMAFDFVSRRVAGDEIARKLGRWEFLLSAEGRPLASIPFVIASFGQVLEGLRVESFEIAGIARSGQLTRIGKTAYVRSLRALCPVVTVTSKLPSPKAGFRMTVAVCVDGEPAGGVEGTLMVDRGSLELVPGEYTLPGIPDGRNSLRISVILLVEGRVLGVREVTLRPTAPRYADAQGRIQNPPSGDELDYDNEAARILSEARLAR